MTVARSDRARIDRALAGDRVAVGDLLREVVPVLQVRVARALVRRRGRTGRDVRQEVEDLVQEVLAALFADDGRILRAWDPDRGLSFVSFCGLVAEREAASILRSGRRSPWTEEATELADLDRDLAPVRDVEPRVASREQLERLLDRLRLTLSPKGLDLFYRLFIYEEAVDVVCAATQMTPDAVYAWRSRLLKLVRSTLAEEVGDSDGLQPANGAMSEAASSRRTSS